MRTNPPDNPINVLKKLVDTISTLETTVPAIDRIKELAKDSYGIFLEQDSYHANFFKVWIQGELAEQGSSSTSQILISNYYKQIKSCLESIIEYELKARSSSETGKGIFQQFLLVLSRELETLNLSLAHHLTLLGKIEGLEKANATLNEIALRLKEDAKLKGEKISELEKQVDQLLLQALGNSGSKACESSRGGGAGKKKGKDKKPDSNDREQQNKKLSNELEKMEAMLVPLKKENATLKAALQKKSDENKAQLAQLSQPAGGSKKKKNTKPSGDHRSAKGSEANAALNNSGTAEDPGLAGGSARLFPSAGQPAAGQPAAGQGKKPLNPNAQSWPFVTQETPSGP
jgi:hypothetical protein